MRYADQPAFVVCQSWHCVPNGRYGTIIGLADEICLFVLSSPFWELVEDAPRS